MPRALLVSLRDPHDPMAWHEQACFAERAELPLDDVRVCFMASGEVPHWSDMRGFDAIFFGGSGAYSVLDPVDWIQRSLDLMLEVVALRLPAYASCFGFQGLALALGGEVVRDDERTEMGSALLALTEHGRQDPLFAGLPDRFWAQEGHHDRVSRLPQGVIPLATGDVCAEQAFRVEGAPFWASQFHPELTATSTLARFQHYRDHYLDAEEADRVFQLLAAGTDSPEVGRLLARLVRGEGAAEG